MDRKTEILVAEATVRAYEYCQNAGIEEDLDTLRNRALDWHNKGHIENSKELAAMTISGDYQELSPDTIRDTTQLLFAPETIADSFKEI